MKNMVYIVEYKGLKNVLPDWYIDTICSVNTVIAQNASWPVGIISLVDNWKPFCPLSRNSIANTYLIFALPLIQSMDVPVIIFY